MAEPAELKFGGGSLVDEPAELKLGGGPLTGVGPLTGEPAERTTQK